MSAPRDLLLVHWSPVRVAALRVSGARGQVRVKGSLVRTKPEALDAADPHAMGAWIGEELDRAGLHTKRAVAVAPRSAIALQRIPASSNLDDQERLAAAELQFRRLGPIDPEGAAVAVRPQTRRRDGEEEGVAVALPSAALAHTRAVIEAAGRRLSGVALSADGLAALAPPGVCMVALASGTRIELSLVRDGAMVFGREGEVALGDRRAASAAVEIRRTLMAARSMGWTLDDAPPQFADADELGATAEQVAEALGEPVAPFATPEELAGAGEHEAAALTPLVGLARAFAANSAFDLLQRPARRRMPQGRRVAYLSIAAVAVVAAGLWIVRDRALADARAGLSAERARAAELQAEYVQVLARDARQRHLDGWLAIEPDWPAYVAWLREQLPPRARLRLSSVRAGVKGEPVFEPERRGVYTDGVFTEPRVVSFTIDGAASDRAAIAEFRARLIATPGVRVEPRSADEPDRFSLRILTRDAAPAAAEAEP